MAGRQIVTWRPGAAGVVAGPPKLRRKDRHARRRRTDEPTGRRVEAEGRRVHAGQQRGARRRRVGRHGRGLGNHGTGSAETSGNGNSVERIGDDPDNVRTRRLARRGAGRGPVESAPAGVSGTSAAERDHGAERDRDREPAPPPAARSATRHPRPLHPVHHNRRPGHASPQAPAPLPERAPPLVSLPNPWFSKSLCRNRPVGAAGADRAWIQGISTATRVPRASECLHT